MAIQTDSAELIVHQGLTDRKTGVATDKHLGQLRHETDLHATNEAKNAWESNIREEANMEIGRARNLVRVV